jgi:endonuclease/exonuclease/phosphatase family metal-dependent hydrolase
LVDTVPPGTLPPGAVEAAAGTDMETEAEAAAAAAAAAEMATETAAETASLLAAAAAQRTAASWLKRHNIKKPAGPRVRVASFNVENLVLRYKFRSGLASCSDTFSRVDTAYSVHDMEQKKLTAAVIHDCNADVLALMEVENLTTIDYFNKAFLQPLGYRYSALVEAHDPRFINVALLSRYPIVAVRSHKDDLDRQGNFLLTRSCLEADVDVHGTPLVLYVNHFRSMRGSDDGRKDSAARRGEQAAKVAEIVADRWASVDFNGNFVVCGDLNDKNDEESAVRVLTKHPRLENVIERLPRHLQWTHHFNGDNTYSQLDYLLVSRTLAELPANIGAKPVIVRAGLPFRARKYRGPRHQVRSASFQVHSYSTHTSSAVALHSLFSSFSSFRLWAWTAPRRLTIARCTLTWSSFSPLRTRSLIRSRAHSRGPTSSTNPGTCPFQRRRWAMWWLAQGRSRRSPRPGPRSKRRQEWQRRRQRRRSL